MGLSFKPGTTARCKYCGKTIERMWTSMESTGWKHTATRDELCYPSTRATPMED